MEKKYKRKSIRLGECDYSEPGDYFVTICSHNRECVFGEIINDAMVLNSLGRIVEKCYSEIPKYFPNTELDIFQIMPNHLHGIIRILFEENNGGDRRGLINQTPTKERNDRWILMRDEKTTLGKVIRLFKAKTSFIIHQNNVNFRWQRNYYEEIVRNEKHYDEIYTYIESNSQTWDRDKNNPAYRLASLRSGQAGQDT